MFGDNPEDFRQLIQKSDLPAVTILYGGKLTLAGITVSHSVASTDTLGQKYLACGPGALVDEDGTLIMESGFIYGNSCSCNSSSGGSGGGVLNRGAFTMTGGTILNNDAWFKGGGVANYGLFTMTGGAISNNNAFTSGGGVVNDGIFIMSGGAISDNMANGAGGYISGIGGGGVANSGVFTMTGGAISGNMCRDGNGNYSSTTGGGGVLNTHDGTFTITSGVISGNMANSYGGGILNTNILVMEGGAISGNVASSDGGGVYNLDGYIYTGGCIVLVVDGAFTMKGGTVSGNTAGGNGGGVYTSNYDKFTTENSNVDIVFSNNRAQAAYQLDFYSHEYNAYGTNIIHAPQVWTIPFEYGYNNFDINYTKYMYSTVTTTAITTEVAVTTATVINTKTIAASMPFTTTIFLDPPSLPPILPTDPNSDGGRNESSRDLILWIGCPLITGFVIILAILLSKKRDAG